MGNSDDITVSIPLAKLDALRHQADQSSEKVLELQKELAEVKLGAADDLAPQLAAALKSTFAVIQFAVGNLDPSTIAGWPYKDLRAIADAIDVTPTLQDDSDIAPLAEELRIFAGLAQGYEEHREERKKQRIAIPASAADFGPKTEEAAHMHAAIQGGGIKPENTTPKPDNAA